MIPVEQRDLSREYPSVQSELKNNSPGRSCGRERTLRVMVRFVRPDVATWGVTNRRRLQILGTDACSLSYRKPWEEVRRYVVAVVYPLRLRCLSLRVVLEKRVPKVGVVIFGGRMFCRGGEGRRWRRLPSVAAM
jgi:hypothetical protein